jgi:tetratricopeptide (TPR) repeat protein
MIRVALTVALVLVTGGQAWAETGPSSLDEARQLVRQGRLAQAANVYRSALPTLTESETLAEAARTLAWAGDRAGALTLYDRLLKHDARQTPRWQTEQARIHAWSGNLAEAERLLQPLVTGADPDARLVLAFVRQRQGRPADALDLAAAVAASEPGRADAALLVTRLKGPSLADWQALRARFPDDAAIGTAVAARYLQDGDIDTAGVLVETVLKQAPGDGEARLLQSRLAHRLGRWDQARSLTGQLAADQPALVEARDWSRKLRGWDGPAAGITVLQETGYDRTIDRRADAIGQMTIADTRLQAVAGWRQFEVLGGVSVPSQRIGLQGERPLGPHWSVAGDVSGAFYPGTGLIPQGGLALTWRPARPWEETLQAKAEQVAADASVAMQQVTLSGRSPLWPGAEAGHHLGAGFYTDGNRHWRYGIDGEQAVWGPLFVRLAWDGQRFHETGKIYQTLPFDLLQAAVLARYDHWQAGLAGGATTGGFLAANAGWAPFLRASVSGETWVTDWLTARWGAAVNRIEPYWTIDLNATVRTVW